MQLYILASYFFSTFPLVTFSSTFCLVMLAWGRLNIIIYTLISLNTRVDAPPSSHTPTQSAVPLAVVRVCCISVTILSTVETPILRRTGHWAQPQGVAVALHPVQQGRQLVNKTQVPVASRIRLDQSLTELLVAEPGQACVDELPVLLGGEDDKRVGKFGPGILHSGTHELYGGLL